MLGLAGYFYSLRKQALRDRERRAARQLRAAHRPSEVDATGSSSARPPDSAVRIDDEDLELYAMDTVDLSGVYVERVEYIEEHRRAGYPRFSSGGHRIRLGPMILGDSGPADGSSPPATV